MNRKITTLWMIKSVLFAIAVNVLILTVMILYAHNIIRDVTSLVILVVIYAASAVAFGFVKGESDKPLLYNLFVLITHSLISIIIISALGFIYKDWKTAMFFWSEIFSAVFFASLLLFDSLICIMKNKIAN